MRSTQVAIVGAGVAGLYAAWRLRREGVDALLLEARDAPGGRLLGLDAGEAGCFDLGAAWFWPALQPQLDALVRELGLARFAQHEAGDMMLERAPGAAPVRVPGYASAPPSMRLAGGMASLVSALRAPLEAGQLLAGHRVRHIACEAGGLRLEADAAGATVQVQAQQVLLALPPRLVARHIAFEPALPAGLLSAWGGTPTWMAPHAKYLAVYERPFWREQGLSGEARSGSGPMGEIHDASDPVGGAALFGFLGVPARVRRGLSPEALIAHCRAQLVRLFGPAAAQPRHEGLKDWALDPYTATGEDAEGGGEHPQPAPQVPAQDGWHGRLVGIGSEWSPQFPGYVAGAIDAAERGLRLRRPVAA